MEDEENRVYSNRMGEIISLSFDLSKDLGKLSSTGNNVLVTTYYASFENEKGEKIRVQLLAYKNPPSAEVNMYG